MRRFGRRTRKALSRANNSVRRAGLRLQTKTMSYLQKIGFGIKRAIAAFRNQKPVYRLGKNGIEVRFFDFSKYNTLPFDRDTYESNQILVGDWANPAYIEIEKIIDEFNKQYDEYTDESSNISGKHIIPSQKYKTFMKQDILKQIFSATGMDMQKITWLLFAVIGLETLIILGIIAVAV